MAKERPQSGEQGGITSLLPNLSAAATGASLDSATPQLSLSQAIYSRRTEYVRPKTIKIKVGTWNTASFKGTEKDLGGWFVRSEGLSENLSGLRLDDKKESDDQHAQVESSETVDRQEARYRKGAGTLPKNDPGTSSAEDSIGLYLLGLQEIVDVSSPSEAFRPYTDSEPGERWKKAVDAALPKGYRLVAEQQLIGLYLLIYASPDVAPDVSAVSTTSVGTGLMGYMGNKGAVTARILLGETTRLVFVNCHLAAGADKGALDRRNWDQNQILTRTKFEPMLGQASGSNDLIDDADVAFWAGDLNYRLADIPGADVRRLLMLHTRNEYDLSQASSNKIEKELADSAKRSRSGSSSSAGSSTSGKSALEIEEEDIGDTSDPASLQTTLDSLLPHDELRKQMQLRKAFHDGWQEGPITFLPTYKYDPGSVGVFDSSEKKRGPSWCDRILYRTRRDKMAYESRLAEELEAKRKDDEMVHHGIDQAGKDEELLYDYDPDEDAADDGEEGFEDTASPTEGVIVTKEGFEDELHLESYVAHQRVLSSDHKPLDAVFTLKYNYVVPELRARVQNEVAREMDKAENEGRPSVTVVVDKHHADDVETTDDDAKHFEGVNFGHVRYATKKQRSLTIANTGQVPAQIVFVDRPVGPGQRPGPSPVWLRTDLDSETEDHPFTGPRILEPGDACNVHLKLRITDRTVVKELNEGIKRLDDILVLRVENGRDHFIPVRGKWLESSLGRSIDRLIRIPEGGIRKLQHQQPKARSTNTDDTSHDEDPPIRWSAPRELFRLTESLERITEQCIAEWEMTSASTPAPWVTMAGWPFVSEQWTHTTPEQRHELSGVICEALDSDATIATAEGTSKWAMLDTMASFLLEYLGSMPDGIITPDLWSKVHDTQKRMDQQKGGKQGELRGVYQEILSEAPPHSIAFVLVTSMIERIVSEQTASTLRNGGTTGQSAEGDEAFRVPPPLIRSGTGSLRKKDLSKQPKVAYRQIVTRRMAEMFAPVVVKLGDLDGKREKSSAEEARVKFLELFISRDE